MSIFQAASIKINNLLGLTARGQTTKANSLPVTLASDEDTINVADGGSTLSIDDNGSTISVDDGGGALTVDCGQLPGSLGQTTMAGSISIAVASNQSDVPVSRPFSIHKINGSTVSADPTVSYNAGDVVGSKLSFSIGGTANSMIRHVTIGISGTYSGTLAMTVIFFTQNPGSTILDDFQYSIGSDAEIVAGIAQFPSTAFQTNITGGAVGSVGVDIPIPAGTSYAVIIADDVFDPGVDQVSIQFGVEQDTE